MITPPENQTSTPQENTQPNILAFAIQDKGNLLLLLLWIFGSFGHFFYLVLPPISLIPLYFGVLLFGLATGGILTYNYLYNLTKTSYIIQIVVFCVILIFQIISLIITASIYYTILLQGFTWIIFIPMFFSLIFTFILLGQSIYKLVTKAYELQDTEEVQLKKRIGSSGVFFVILLTAEFLQLFIFLVHEHQEWVSFLPISLGIYLIFLSLGSFMVSSVTFIKTDFEGYYNLLKFEVTLLWLLLGLHTLATIIIGILLITIDLDLDFFYIFLFAYLPFSGIFSAIFLVVSLVFSIISFTLILTKKSIESENSIQLPPEEIGPNGESKEIIYDEI